MLGAMISTPTYADNGNGKPDKRPTHTAFNDDPSTMVRWSRIAIIARTIATSRASTGRTTWSGARRAAIDSTPRIDDRYWTNDRGRAIGKANDRDMTGDRRARFLCAIACPGRRPPVLATICESRSRAPARPGAVDSALDGDLQDIHARVRAPAAQRAGRAQMRTYARSLVPRRSARERTCRRPVGWVMDFADMQAGIRAAV